MVAAAGSSRSRCDRRADRGLHELLPHLHRLLGPPVPRTLNWPSSSSRQGCYQHAGPFLEISWRSGRHRRPCRPRVRRELREELGWRRGSRGWHGRRREHLRGWGLCGSRAHLLRSCAGRVLVSPRPSLFSRDVLPSSVGLCAGLRARARVPRRQRRGSRQRRGRRALRHRRSRRVEPAAGMLWDRPHEVLHPRRHRLSHLCRWPMDVWEREALRLQRNGLPDGRRLRVRSVRPLGSTRVIV
jgi:hypothetical protein